MADFDGIVTAVYLDAGQVVNAGQKVLTIARPEIREALRLNADNPEAHFNLGYMLLASGNYKEGWKEMEWRWKRQDIPVMRPIRR